MYLYMCFALIGIIIIIYSLIGLYKIKKMAKEYPLQVLTVMELSNPVHKYNQTTNDTWVEQEALLEASNGQQYKYQFYCSRLKNLPKLGDKQEFYIIDNKAVEPKDPKRKLFVLFFGIMWVFTCLYCS